MKKMMPKNLDIHMIKKKYQLQYIPFTVYNKLTQNEVNTLIKKLKGYTYFRK